jgi:uncharacterized damage-inducible protein DinB
MKTKFIALLFFAGMQYLEAQTLETVLVNQLKTTHNKQDWFVPVNIALDGLTAEQAAWKDDSGNHSIGQLANHLLFWNERQLIKFKGQNPPAFSGNNEETFNAFTKEQWNETVKKLNNVLTELEKIIENADEASLKSWAETIANISTHNAYHTGQIVFARKLQGSWQPEKGGK